MHYLMLVTLSLGADADSLAARTAVRESLEADDSFCGTGGRFGAPLADWFVIGGRWSGYLAKVTMPEAYRTRLKDGFPRLASGLYSDRELQPHADGLNALWSEFGGRGPSPYNRTGYEHLGYEDDAMPLSPDLFGRLLTEYVGETLVTDAGHCKFVDLDGDPLDEGLVGRKWLVVVDYHN